MDLLGELTVSKVALSTIVEHELNMTSLSETNIFDALLYIDWLNNL